MNGYEEIRGKVVIFDQQHFLLVDVHVFKHIFNKKLILFCLLTDV